MLDAETKKIKAAEAALACLPPDIVLGVGTGSTVNHFIDLLGKDPSRIKAAVSSSEASSKRLKQFGIDVWDLNSAGTLDWYVDGADEATRHRALIKGGGAALTREKIVAAASRQFICIVDDSKIVPVLGKFPLPVEVIPMARSYVARQIVALGGQPVWREGVVTDNGNAILDVHHMSIVDPIGLEATLNQIAGVVTNGLFAKRPADILLVASDRGIERIE
jgi:ribose 5-phosphate isomerase A